MDLGVAGVFNGFNRVLRFSESYRELILLES